MLKENMIASTQITNTEVFVFMAVLFFKLLSRKDNRNCQKRKLHSKEIANFTGNLLQNYKWLECEIFRIPLKSFINAFSICMIIPLKSQRQGFEK